jgi:hypothetical protein
MSTNSNCQSHEETLIFYESTYTKHKIVLEKLQTLIVRYWSQLKSSCVPFTCIVSKPINFEKKSIIHVQDCLICNENFHCNDICVVSCHHCYHLGVYLCNAPLQSSVRWRDVNKSSIQLGGYHLGFLTKSKWNKSTSLTSWSNTIYWDFR